MKWAQTKLKKEALGSLRRVPVPLFAPFTLVAYPVYIYLPKNEKFVAVKAPLGFFSPEELKKYSTYESFYLPQELEQFIPYQRVGEAIRSILKTTQQEKVTSNEGEKNFEIPASIEAQNEAILGILKPLWENEKKVLTFGMTMLVHEICPPMEPQFMVQRTDRNIAEFELSLLQGDFAIFLGLHLGWFDVRSVQQIRQIAFSDAEQFPPTELADLVLIAQKLLPTLESEGVDLHGLSTLSNKTARKLTRLIGGAS